MQDKLFLQSINAPYLQEKKGYFKPLELLDIEVKQAINKVYLYRQTIKDEAFKLYAVNNDVVPASLTLQFQEAIKKLLIFHLVRRFKKNHHIIEQYLNIESFINVFAVNTIINNVVKRKTASFVKKLVVSRIATNDLIEEFNQSLKLSLFNEIGFLLRNLLFDTQKNITIQEYKTTKFYWIHRNPPQPQDRKLHIYWWRSKKLFDFNDLPFNYQTGSYDFPGRLIHCHCRAQIVV